MQLNDYDSRITLYKSVSLDILLVSRVRENSTFSKEAGGRLRKTKPRPWFHDYCKGFRYAPVYTLYDLLTISTRRILKFLYDYSV